MCPALSSSIGKLKASKGVQKARRGRGAARARERGGEERRAETLRGDAEVAQFSVAMPSMAIASLVRSMPSRWSKMWRRTLAR